MGRRAPDSLGLGFQFVDFDVQIRLEPLDAYAVVLGDEAQQQMGHADAGMVQALGLGEGAFDDMLGLYAQFAQELDGRTLFHADQPQQETFGAHAGMVQAQRRSWANAFSAAAAPVPSR